MRKIRKIFIIMMVTCMVVVSTMSVYAQSGSATKSMRGSSAITKFSNTLSWVNGGFSGCNVTINGGTITNQYSVNNTWNVYVNYEYRVSGILLSARFNTTARVQFGSTFYVWSTN